MIRIYTLILLLSLSPLNNIIGDTINPLATESSIPVKFKYISDQEIVSIAVAGDFNAWNTTSHKMIRIQENVWEITILINPGIHHYKFVINNHIWILDPNSTRIESDRFGGYNSVIEISNKYNLHISFYEDCLNRNLWKARLNSPVIDRLSINSTLTHQNHGYWSNNNVYPSGYINYLVELSDGTTTLRYLDPSNVMMGWYNGVTMSLLTSPVKITGLLASDWSSLRDTDIILTERIGNPLVSNKTIEYVAKVGNTPFEVKFLKPVNLSSYEVVHFKIGFNDITLTDDLAFELENLYSNLTPEQIVKHLRFDVGYISNDGTTTFFGYKLMPIGTWFSNYDNMILWIIARLPIIFNKTLEAKGLILRYYINDTTLNEEFFAYQKIFEVYLLDFDQGRDNIEVLNTNIREAFEVYWQGIANSVSVVGDFNNWDPTRTQLIKIGRIGNENLYKTILYLYPGWYRYYLVVDGLQKLDPYNIDYTGYIPDGCTLDKINIKKVGYNPYILTKPVGIANKITTSIILGAYRNFTSQEFRFDGPNIILDSYIFTSSIRELGTFKFIVDVMNITPEYLRLLERISTVIIDVNSVPEELNEDQFKYFNSMITTKVIEFVNCDNQKFKSHLRCENSPVQYKDNIQIVDNFYWEPRLRALAEFMANNKNISKLEILLNNNYKSSSTSGFRIADALFRAMALVQAYNNDIAHLRFDAFASGQKSILNFDGILKHPSFESHAIFANIASANKLIFTNIDNHMVAGIFYVSNGVSRYIIINSYVDKILKLTISGRLNVKTLYGESLDSTRWLMRDVNVNSNVELAPISINIISKLN